MCYFCCEYKNLINGGTFVCDSFVTAIRWYSLVDFDANTGTGAVSTIWGTLDIRYNGGTNNQAPILEVGSLLRYSSGGTYARNNEWRNPWHVTVTNSTFLNMRGPGVDPGQSLYTMHCGGIIN